MATVVETPRKPRVSAKQKAAQKAGKREAAAKNIEAAARLMLTSEGWLAWAKVRAKFHKYSWSNCALILAQCPEATRVAGFRKWQEMGRQVKGGGKSIKIFGYSTYTVEGDKSKGEKDRTGVFYPIVSVFDISQTEGDPLPEHPGEPITGDSHKAFIAPLKAFAKTLGYSVTTADLPGNVGGYCDAKAKRIVLGKGVAVNATVRVLIHEIAHAMGVGYEGYGRQDAEVIVETVTFIVASSIGLDTGTESIPYVAGWGEADNLDAIKAHAKLVDDLARQIEKACDKVKVAA